MAIENRDLPIGTRLVATYKKLHYEVVVEEGPAYRIDVSAQRDLEGKTYKSPSSAAMAIIGGAANGWRFFSLPEGATSASVAADSAETPAKAKGKARGGRKGKRLELITFLGGDHTKFWCAACQEAYAIEVGALLPDACPRGHRADDPELVEGAAPEPTAAEAGEAEMPEVVA